MKKIFFVQLMFVPLNNPDLTNPSDEDPFRDRHMKNVTKLTFEGDNGEAYFSKDNTKLIFQSNPWCELELLRFFKVVKM